MKKLKFYFLSAISALLFFSCATSIPVTVTKPSEIRTVNARKIAVMDVSYPSLKSQYGNLSFYQLALMAYYGYNSHWVDQVQRATAESLRDQITAEMVNSGYFTVFRPSDILSGMDQSNALGLSMQDMSSKSDIQAYFVGEITRMDSDVQQTQIRTTGADKKPIIQDAWTKTVNLSFSYRILNSKTGQVLGTRTFTDKREDQKIDYSKLATDENLYADIIKNFPATIIRQIAPYQVTEFRTLMTDETKDQAMIDTEEMVKNKMYDKALEKYLTIYNGSKNPAAGFNAAILYEINGDLDTAIKTMEALYNENPKPAIKQELDRMMATKKEREVVETMTGIAQ